MLRNNITHNRRIAGIAFWLWGITILILTIIPNTPSMKIQTGNFEFRFDYIIHFGVYFSLGVLFYLWFVNGKTKFQSSKIFGLVLCGIILAGIGELAQIIVPGRTFNIMDFYSNNLGLFSGVFIPVGFFNKKNS